ncbi:MAG: hypothetical protein R2713_03910 [Ilumatobacteraceae bacterium]
MTETTMGGMDMTETTMGEMAPAMEMVPVQQIDLAAGEPVALAPAVCTSCCSSWPVRSGGHHDPDHARVRERGSLVVDVPVLDEAP